MSKIIQGPGLAFSDELHAQKYRGPGETFYESICRVAGHLCDDQEHFYELRDILGNQRFLPGGRVQASAGASKIVSPINCFMSGDIQDSFTKLEPGSAPDAGHIMQRATEAASTMRLGGGIGTNFSTIRPRNSKIKTLDSPASGPVSFMRIFNAVGQVVASSGHRRGAQMGVLTVEHPDCEEFIHAKNNNYELTAFNMSVLATNKFMQAVKDGISFDTQFEGESWGPKQARPLWDTIMRSTYDYSEPGVLFIDTINDNNNLNYCETITGTNPCGEIPLPPFGACLLGSANLVKYVDFDAGKFNWSGFKADVGPSTRALDNVIDRASIWPMEEQEREMKDKRRIGMGITGLANAGEALGMPYGSEEFIKFMEKVLRTQCYAAYRESIKIAQEKGPFPKFDKDKHLSMPFIKKLPADIREGIAEHGIRNSHLLAIAPTGTISMTADNVSSGIEPVFSHEFNRTVAMPEGPRMLPVKDYGYRVYGVKGRTAGELSPMEHLDVLSAAAPLIDQSISKTINVAKDIPWEDFKGIYMRAWETGCKGCTTYRVGGLREGILTEEDTPEEEESASCRIDSDTGRRDCD